MYRLRHSPETVALAMKMGSEGNGIRETGRILGKSHATIIGWEKHLEKNDLFEKATAFIVEMGEKK